MTRVSPHVIATRLTPSQLAATSAAAQARGQSVSEYTRQAIRAACVTLLTAESGSPEYKLAAVADLLELPKDATAEEIIAAIGELGDDVSAAIPTDPLEAAPDPPPPAKTDAYGFTQNSALAFPTTPAQQKKWLDDRAAQRAKSPKPAARYELDATGKVVMRKR